MLLSPLLFRSDITCNLIFRIGVSVSIPSSKIPKSSRQTSSSSSRSTLANKNI